MLDSTGTFSVRNEAWSASAGPQTTKICGQGSWITSSNQPDNAGAVQTYPDTLYTVGGGSGTSPSKKTVAEYKSITSTFSEQYPAQGNWDATYDIWLNNWGTEIMILNEWNGSPGYWQTQARQAVTLNGVGYHFLKNGTALQFYRDKQVKSGSVDILAAMKWLQTQGLMKTTDIPTQMEYGVEICSTVGTQTFPTTGVTFAMS